MQLTSAVGATDRTLELDEPYLAAAWMSYIQVDDEVMLVGRGDGTDRLKVQRGRSGTTAASHDAGATVVAVGGGGSHNHSGVYLEPST